MSTMDLNTSDLSGNDSSDGSGTSRASPWPIASPRHLDLGEENFFDEPFRMRSAESKFRRLFTLPSDL